MLQLEGAQTVSQVAERLGVARSTAHRLLAMLVYRDFAVQDGERGYRAGPILELVALSQSRVSQIRAAALPHLARLVDLLAETANVAILTGDTTRFIASVECQRGLQVGSREGMVFPAYRTTAGLLMLAELDDAELTQLYQPGHGEDLPQPSVLRRELARVRRAGFAINRERSERGLVAVGVLLREPDGRPTAGVSICMPSVRFRSGDLPSLVASLQAASGAITAELAR